MSIFITLIAALIVFSAVIAIHEFGHFTVAKLCGIQVNEFSIGMGPAVWHRKKGETAYSFRILPIGAFVELAPGKDGLVHISQVADKFIRHPSEVVSVGDIVKVVVLEVDEKKKRISLSMKQAK